MTSPTKKPEGFRYETVLRKGKPVHAPFDAFSIRHPAMPLGRRAKIFSPFDALKGFADAIAEKETASLRSDEVNLRDASDSRDAEALLLRGDEAEPPYSTRDP